jgi:hypothetical protein
MHPGTASRFNPRYRKLNRDFARGERHSPGDSYRVSTIRRRLVRAAGAR